MIVQAEGVEGPIICRPKRIHCLIVTSAGAFLWNARATGGGGGRERRGETGAAMRFAACEGSSSRQNPTCHCCSVCPAGSNLHDVDVSQRVHCSGKDLARQTTMPEAPVICTSPGGKQPPQHHGSTAAGGQVFFSLCRVWT